MSLRAKNKGRMISSGNVLSKIGSDHRFYYRTIGDLRDGNG